MNEDSEERGVPEQAPRRSPAGAEVMAGSGQAVGVDDLLDGSRNGSILPDFEVALWGYHRQQVERCLADLTARLEDALSRGDSVPLLQQELCQTRVELDQLRKLMQREPHWSYRLAQIMKKAEQLRQEAQQRGGEPDSP